MPQIEAEKITVLYGTISGQKPEARDKFASSVQVVNCNRVVSKGIRTIHGADHLTFVRSMITFLLLMNIWFHRQRERRDNKNPRQRAILQTRCCQRHITKTVIDASLTFAVCPFCYDTKPVGRARRVLSTRFQQIFVTRD